MTSAPSDVLDLVQGWPTRDVVCFRGQASVSPAVVGDEVALDGLCAATTDSGVATDNFTTPGVLAVAAGVRRVVHAGRAHDGEVVLLPGTRLRVVGQARSGDLVVTLLTDVANKLDATQVGRLAAAAIRRDRAHEPHPDLPPGRFVGALVAAPPGTWNPDELVSAESPDYSTMSTEEVRAWFAAKERSSLERFRDAPPPRLNPQKVADHPHLRHVGWEVRFSAGVSCVLTLGDDVRPGAVVGLRQLEGSDRLVVVIDADGRWACERADGAAWAPSVDDRTGSAGQRDVPVVAWRVTDDDLLHPPARGRQVAATLRTVVGRA